MLIIFNKEVKRGPKILVNEIKAEFMLESLTILSIIWIVKDANPQANKKVAKTQKGKKSK